MKARRHRPDEVGLAPHTFRGADFPLFPRVFHLQPLRRSEIGENRIDAVFERDGAVEIDEDLICIDNLAFVMWTTARAGSL